VKLPDDEVIRRFSSDGTVQSLPPWTGDDHAMMLWLVRVLPVLWGCGDDPHPLVRSPWDAWNAYDPQAEAITATKFGNIEPLRKCYPDIAEYIHLPKRGRGKRFPNPMADCNPIDLAALDAQRIRALWKKFYPKQRRRRGDKSAEAFAVELWTGYAKGDGRHVVITEKMVKNRLKKLSPSK
jgi:hypothetical protein